MAGGGVVRLTRVTITGADDGVDPYALAALSEKYPFVEWGLLMSKKRFGEPRYPSKLWLLNVADVVGFKRLSYHLCGEFARRAMGGDPTMVPRQIERMQLNGFSGYRLPCLVAAEACRELEFILQCDSAGALLNADELREQHGYQNVVALWDPSGGAGSWLMESGGWLPRQSDVKLPFGYAGGISEHNIEDTIAALCNGTGNPTWIDLESGARTDDKFDLAKVERILKLAAPFVT